MNKYELYDWYIENCTKEEIPLSFIEWEREIYPKEKKLWNKLANKNCLICDKELIGDEAEIYDGLCEYCFGECRN